MSVRSLAAPAVFLLVLAGGSTAWAQEEARSCETVRTELASAQTAAELPVTIGGGLFNDLPSLQQFYDSVVDVPAAEVAAAEAKAVLDAAAQVDVLTEEATTCVEEPTTPEPTETPSETPSETPAETPEPAQPDTVYYADCAAAPGELLLTDPGYRVGLDSDGDGLACELTDDTTDDSSDTTVGGADLSQGIETGI